MFEARRFFIWMCALVALYACSSGGDGDAPQVIPPSATEKWPIRISCKPMTRVADDAFETGDKIGLFVVNHNEDGSVPSLKPKGNYIDNCLYSLQGTWVTDVATYWRDTVTHADFYLYYPYVPSLASVEAMTWNVKADQSVPAYYRSSELLIGKSLDVAPSESPVDINVEHAMAQMVIHLKAGKGFTEASLAASRINIKINQLKTQATANLSTGGIAAMGDVADVTPLKTEDGYKALVVPQALDVDNLITVTVDGTDYHLPRASELASLDAGRRYLFTVTLSKISNNGVNVSITHWEDDGIDYGGTAEY